MTSSLPRVRQQRLFLMVVGVVSALGLILIFSPQKSHANTLPSLSTITPNPACGPTNAVRYFIYIQHSDLVDNGNNNFTYPSTKSPTIDLRMYAASKFACQADAGSGDTRGPATLHFESYTFTPYGGSAQPPVSGGAVGSRGGSGGLGWNSEWQEVEDRSFTLATGGVNTLKLRLGGITCTVVNGGSCSPMGGAQEVTLNISYGAPTLPTCNLSGPPSSPAPGQPVNLTWTTTGSPTLAILTPPGGSGGELAQPTAGWVQVYPNSSTTYSVTVSNGAGSGPPCYWSVTVGGSTETKPYLRVYGGDVQAGGGFGEGCTVTSPSTKTILAFGGQAGTNMAAFALSTITGFSSANTAGGASYHTVCAANYWPGAPNTADLTPPSQPGENKVVYRNGDVTIDADIAYANDGEGWTKLSDIQSFYLIVRGGNIRIKGNVKKLDGTYVAMPNEAGVGGIIYTCVQNDGTPFSTSVPTSVCNETLTVNGAFIAKQVKFLRTRGDISNGEIAEVFRYGPEIWVR